MGCEDEMSFLSEVKKFANEEIRPFASKFDEEKELPRDLINKMALKGYLGVNLPTEYGGLGYDSTTYGLFTEEIGKACCSTRTLLTVHSSLVGETLVRFGTKKQKDELIYDMIKGKKIGAFALTEPEIGSNAKNVQTTYKKVGNKYIINGQKKWISFAEISDFFIVIASCEGVVSAFIVERYLKGITIKPMKNLLAAKASHIAEISFSNVEVPCENLIAKEGMGFLYVANSALDSGRFSIAWAGVGIAQESIDEMVTYSQSRMQFDKKLCEFQLVKGLIADSITKTHAARALCLKASELRNINSKDAVIETTIAKYFSSQVAMQVSNDALQIHGGNGCCTSYIVERLFREAKILEIIEGTSQIQQILISNYGLNKYYKKSNKI